MKERAYADAWGFVHYERAENPDFKIVDGLAFPRWLSCGNYSTPWESPYGYGPHVVAGPKKKFEGDDLLADYDDRLRQFYPERWEESRRLLKGQQFESCSLKQVSRFLSGLYGFEVDCLQIFKGCNVGNGYPYYIFISKRVAPEVAV